MMFNRLRRSLGLASETAGNDPPGSEAGTPKPAVVDVTDADFEAIALKSDKLVVVDFWADWCHPCETMSAYISFLSIDFADRLLVTALDVDENPETQTRYNVMALPTLIFLRAGEEIHRQVGVQPYAQLKALTEHLLDEAGG